MTKNEFKMEKFRGLNTEIKVGDYIIYKNKQYKVSEISGDKLATFFTLRDYEIIGSSDDIIEATIGVLLFNSEVEQKIKLCKSEYTK